jgi:hypothetical protein
MEREQEPGYTRDSGGEWQPGGLAEPGRPTEPARTGLPDANGEERARRDPASIRAEDTEPYVALQYVARLFKIVAMVVVVALTAEIVAGVWLEGAGALLGLTFEVIRGVVLAAILWGAGDLTLLLIDVGHDVRAQRVLLGRLTARSAGDFGERKERQQPR